MGVQDLLQSNPEPGRTTLRLGLGGNFQETRAWVLLGGCHVLRFG